MSSVKLTPQYIFALVVAASLLLGYLFYTFVIQPKQTEIATINDEITQRETTLASDRAKVAQVPALTQQVETLEKERAQFVRALPATANFGEVVADLKQTVSAAGGDLTSLTFSSGSNSNTSNTTLPAGVRPIGITMNVNGEFPKLFQILRSLELQNRFTTVDNVSLQTGTSPGRGTTLGSTMGLTVYTFDAAQAAGATPAAGAPGEAAAPAAPAPAAPASGGTQ